MSKISKSLIISLLFSILILFSTEIEKTLNGFGAIIWLVIAVLFVVILVNVKKEIIFIFKKKASLTVSVFFPVLIYILVPFLTSFINIQNFESKVIYRGYYKGTQNQAKLLFRENGTFELNYTGIFFLMYGIRVNGKKRGIQFFLLMIMK
jgi:hypothetical protein